MVAHPAAAEPLAQLLRQPGMSGYAMTSLELRPATDNEPPPATASRENRSQAVRELMAARALYRCGDHDGLGKKTLTEYTNDLRGHFARHAFAVLHNGDR